MVLFLDALRMLIDELGLIGFRLEVVHVKNFLNEPSVDLLFFIGKKLSGIIKIALIDGMKMMSFFLIFIFLIQGLLRLLMDVHKKILINGCREVKDEIVELNLHFWGGKLLFMLVLDFVEFVDFEWLEAVINEVDLNEFFRIVWVIVGPFKEYLFGGSYQC